MRVTLSPINVLSRPRNGGFQFCPMATHDIAAKHSLVDKKHFNTEACDTESTKKGQAHLTESTGEYPLLAFNLAQLLTSTFVLKLFQKDRGHCHRMN